METLGSNEEILKENQELRWQLEEANETIEAIRNGQVDALVVKNKGNHQLYTLKSADQTYRVFIEKMNEGVATVSKEGFILYANTRLAKMVNLPLDKVIGIPFETLVAEESKSKYRLLTKEGWKKDAKDEVIIKDRFDKLTYCLISCTAIELDEGLTLSLILTDLTTQKKNQNQLKIQNEQLLDARNLTEKLNNELEATVKERTKDLLVSREHFKLLANHITQMTWTNLPNGDVNYYNQRWYDYTGLTFDETREWGWRAVVHPDDIEETIAKYVTALQTGGIFEVENRYRRGIDGTYRWHLNRSMPLRNEHGEIIFWVGTATDIEEQKRELERKDEFIGVASHELKTPLTSLKGYLQLMAMQREGVSPTVKQYVAKANGALSKLQYLVDDLLDVSKIKAGRLNYSIDTINLRTVIDNCMENAIHIHHGNNFDVVNNTDFMIRGNAERLEQVLMNLINNAVKYSQTNKDIIVKVSEFEKSWVRVSVSDHGVGLTDEQKYKIFERFYRVEDKKYMTSGLGMGLYISSEIVNTHSGKIGVESEFGKGSTFYFDLPLEIEQKP